MRSPSRRKAWLWLAAAILVATALAAGLRVYRIAVIGSGFSAEILCGAVFVSGRDEAAVKAEDLSGPGYELLRFFRQRVERDKKRVIASAYGLALADGHLSRGSRLHADRRQDGRRVARRGGGSLFRSATL